MAHTPAPTPPADKPAADPITEFRVATVHDDGRVVIELGDDRMLTVKVKEGVEVKVGDMVAITADGQDSHGVPKNAEVVKLGKS